ncbi:hypothetical protein [Krasilnikoviella flava]|uniref:hypothetical protein n=1 Tax=Krasilnikoviella flava TaxID=526729 RepID=UPI0009A7DFB9|nr:hypothetical protein [Krasilnikoviella flava]
MPLRNVRFVLPVAVLCGALVLTGCAGSPPDGTAGPSTGAPAVAVRDLSTHTVLLDADDPVELALTTSQTVYARSEVVVLADADDEAAREALAATAVAVHAPALLADTEGAGTGIAEELERLGARAAVVVTGEERSTADDDGTDAGTPGADDGTTDADDEPGAASRRVADAAGVQALAVTPDVVEGEDGAGPALEGDDLEDLGSRLDAMLGDDPAVSASAPGGAERDGADEPRLLREVLALVDPTDGQEAAIASLRAAGAVTTEVPGGDLGTRHAVQTVDRAQALTVVGVGSSFGDAATFAWRVAAAERAAMLPTGSQHLLPARYVAVDATVWDDPAAAVARAQAAAAAYVPVDDTAAEGEDADAPEGPVVPTLVLPVSATAGGPGEDGDWVTQEDLDALAPLVSAARDAGVYVLLDVGAGPAPAVEQVRAAEALLRTPGVGVALHPESRVGDGTSTTSHQMSAAELDEVTAYLADLVSREGLPPSLLVVHQTRPESVPDRSRLRPVPQVEVAVLADLTGGATTGEWVWNQVSAGLPEGVHLGWSGPASGVAGSLVPTDPAPVLIATS